MGATDSKGNKESIATVVNPEADDLTLELEFFDETMEGVDGVSMPDPPEEP